MAIINLVMLGVAIVQMIITAWTGVGAAAGALQIAGTKITIRTLAKQLLTQLWKQTIKGGIRNFKRGGLRGVGKTALRGGAAYSGFILATRAGSLCCRPRRGTTRSPTTSPAGSRCSSSTVSSRARSAGR